MNNIVTTVKPAYCRSHDQITCMLNEQGQCFLAEAIISLSILQVSKEKCVISKLIKKLEDKIISALLLLLIFPVLLLVALAIKLDSSGPVFFYQKRYGFNNRLINIIKFRSMYHTTQDLDAETLTSRHDPRVTRVGRILRRTSADELPQLLNILKGEMSLVGPRPHATKATVNGKLYHDVLPCYFIRHVVKPGLTGLAQVNGWRGETDSEEKLIQRVKHDLCYIKNWSLWLDLKIILKTVLVCCVEKNAY